MKNSIFSAQLDIIGINPFVLIPDAILQSIFVQAKKDRGPIPVRGTLNGIAYIQTLVKFRGEWRFYVNTVMLKNSPKRIGETVEITIEFDPATRTVKPHPKLRQALRANTEALRVFETLQPSQKQEIIKYISTLKTEKSVNTNITKVLNFLLKGGEFLGREL